MIEPIEVELGFHSLKTWTFWKWFGVSAIGYAGLWVAFYFLFDLLVWVVDKVC